MRSRDVLRVVPLERARFELGDFLVRKKLLVGTLTGSLQGRNGPIVPDALEVRMPVGCSGGRPPVRRGRLGLGHRNHQEPCAHNGQEVIHNGILAQRWER